MRSDSLTILFDHIVRSRYLYWHTLKKEKSMKKIANILTPFAAFIFFGACMVSGVGLLVVSMASIGFGDGLPWAYYLRLYLPLLSIALPVAGMIFFAVILLADSIKTTEIVRPTVVDGAGLPPVSEGVKKEEALPKAA
jgi:hypothetical protein